MSKSANPGELHTPVRFVKIHRENDDDAFSREREINVFGPGSTVRVKWVNAHGTDVFMAMQMQIKEPATITCRYSKLITIDCIVYKADDPRPYEIISIDNVEERNRWMEIKVQRRSAAR